MRTFLARCLLLFCLAAPPAAAPTPTRPPVTFEEVSPAASGITRAHDNAHSAERYLPETVGAGCAFFDYDNAKFDSVEIRWPSGRVDKLTNLPVNAYVRVAGGEGAAKADGAK